MACALYAYRQAGPVCRHRVQVFCHLTNYSINKSSSDFVKTYVSLAVHLDPISPLMTAAMGPSTSLQDGHASVYGGSIRVRPLTCAYAPRGASYV